MSTVYCSMCRSTAFRIETEIEGQRVLPGRVETGIEGERVLPGRVETGIEGERVWPGRIETGIEGQKVSPRQDQDWNSRTKGLTQPGPE